MAKKTLPSDFEIAPLPFGQDAPVTAAAARAGLGGRRLVAAGGEHEVARLGRRNARGGPVIEDSLVVSRSGGYSRRPGGHGGQGAGSEQKQRDEGWAERAHLISLL